MNHSIGDREARLSVMLCIHLYACVVGYFIQQHAYETVSHCMCCVERVTHTCYVNVGAYDFPVSIHRLSVCHGNYTLRVGKRDRVE